MAALLAPRNEIGRQSLVLYGFALFGLWMYLTLYGTLVPDGEAAYRDAVNAPAFFSFLSPVVVALATALFGLEEQWFRKALSRPWVIATMVLLALAGTWAMATMGRMEEARHWVSLAMHIVFEAFLLSWLLVFRDFDLEIVAKRVPELLLITILGAVAIAAASPLVKAILFMGLPVAQGALLLFGHAKIDVAAASEELLGRRSMALIMIPCALACVIAGLFLSLTRFHGTAFIHAAFNQFFGLEVAVVLYGASLVPVARDLAHRRRLQNSFAGIAVVAAALCPVCLVLALLVVEARTVLTALGVVSINLAFIEAFLLLGHYFRTSAFRLFAYGRALYSAGSAISNLIVYLLLTLPKESQLTVEIFMLLIAGQCTVMIAFALFATVKKSALDRRKNDEEVPPSLPRDKTPVPEMIIGRYGLSEREGEVLALLLRGRSIKRIAEELFLSTGTINTYLYRIYQKIGIHTRQELFDLAESLDGRRDVQ